MALEFLKVFDGDFTFVLITDDRSDIGPNSSGLSQSKRSGEPFASLSLLLASRFAVLGFIMGSP